VRLVWRDAPNPNNPDSKRVATLAEAAFAQRGSEGFWKLHDLIATHASERGRIDDDTLRRYAAQSGIEPGTLVYLFNDSHSGDHHLPIANDTGLEPPAIVVGDVVYRNAMPPLATLDRVVDDQLAARHVGETR
jgi:hypothetical protein